MAVYFVFERPTSIGSASEASRARTCELAAKPPPLSRLLSRAPCASTFHNIPQMESLLTGYKEFGMQDLQQIPESTIQDCLGLLHMLHGANCDTMSGKMTWMLEN